MSWRLVLRTDGAEHRCLRSPLAAGAFLFGRPLGCRQDLEAPVGNWAAALEREAERPGREALLGTLDRGELCAQVVGQTLVELLLIELGSAVRRVEEGIRLFAIVLALEPGERVLDPAALGSE